MFYNAWYRKQLNRLVVKNVLCFSVWKDLSSGFGCLFTELFKKKQAIGGASNHNFFDEDELNCIFDFLPSPSLP